MSVRNNAVTLADTMNSLFEQTYKKFHLIVVDDASDDETPKILKKFADNHKNVTLVLNEKPLGLAKNLNMMLSMADTEFVARMDGDDICYPERFAKQVKFLTSHPDIDILGTAAHIINEHGAKSGRLCWPEKHKDIRKIIWCNPMIHPSIMMRRQKILDIGGYPDYRRKQDYALWFKAMKAGLRFHNLQKAYIQYRIVKRHYKKTTLKYALLQTRIGWGGYLSLGGVNPKAYIMMSWPIVRWMLPSRVQRRLQKLLRRFDPRRKIQKKGK